MKLTKAIIKKAGGINKKAWSLLRASKNKHTTTKRAKPMARRKRRGFFKKSHRGAGGDSVLETMGTGAVYGAIRQPVGDFIQSKAGNFANGYADELIIGGLSLLGAWKGKGMIKRTSHKVLFAESARVSSGMTSGLMGGSSQAVVGQSGVGMY